jgi:hypothetical protein
VPVRYLAPVTFFDRVKARLSGATVPTSDAVDLPGQTQVGPRSPWVTGSLSKIVWADILGTESLPVSRAEAMGVPAIARSRHLLTSDAARCPFSVYDEAGRVAGAGGWLQSTSLAVSPQHRAVWTVDDLIFGGWSLWVAQREDNDPEGEITDAARVPVEWWQFGDGGRIEIGGDPVPAHQAILIPGYHEGILNSSPRTIRGSRELETQWANRASNPIPAMELHQTTPDQMTGTEIADLVSDWQTAMRENGGAVAYTPSSIEARPHGTAESDLLVQGRNAAAVDGARIVGVPAAMIDASNVNSSLTYETLSGRNLEYVDRSLALYLGPIEARLSLDDVCAPGQRVRADTSAVTSSTPNPTGTTTED